MNAAQQILCRDGLTDKSLVALVPDLIGHHTNLLDPQILGQPLHIAVGLDTAGTRLNDHDKLVHIGSGAPAQVLQTGLHIHNDHIVLAEGQGGQDGFEHHVLRAYTAGAAHIHRTHDQQLDAVDVLGVLLGDVGHVGVQLIEPVGIGSSGALFHQGAHFADGDNGIHFLLAQA